MILVVVFMHAIPANQMKIGIMGDQGLADNFNMTFVVFVVDRISFGLANYATIEHFLRSSKAQLFQFSFREFD